MSATNAAAAMANCLVDEFARCGMTDAVLAPGSRSAPLAYALADDARIRVHVSIDERSAGFFAVGLAKATGRPVAILSTSGTAAANLHPAAVEARHSRVPLIMLTADRPPELRDTGAAQTIDQIKMFGSDVVWFAELGVPQARAESVSYWRALACKAYGLALGSPRGPVHINCPLREPLVPEADAEGFPFPVEGRLEQAPWIAVERSQPRLAERDVAALAGRLSEVERGLIVLGDGDLKGDAVESLSAALSWPVLAEASSGARTGEQAISTYDSLLRVSEFRAAHRPDLVLAAGSVGTSNALLDFLDPSIEQVVVDADVWPDPRRATARIVRAEPAHLFEDLGKAVTLRGASSWLQDWLEADAKSSRVVEEILATYDLSEPMVARSLADALPHGSTLVVGASMPVRDIDWFAKPRGGLRFVSNRGANGIDGFVSTALGVAAGASGPVFALTGDLALLHDQNGFLIQRETPSKVVFVVINNDGGGVFSFLPQASHPHFERLFATPHGIELATFARAHRLNHALVEEASEFILALEHAGAEDGIHLVEVRTDRAKNVEIHQSIWRAVSEGL